MRYGHKKEGRRGGGGLEEENITKSEANNFIVDCGLL